jgi:hypothetical protein
MIPRGARSLRTYQEFESYLVDFVQGRYHFLWVVGRPGVGKSESIKAAVRVQKAFCSKGGQLTPLAFYIACYHHRGQPVILDDGEHLLGNGIGKRLVSALADTSPAKLMCWATTSRALGEVPPRYFTDSPLCIISNRATADEAIQSRAVTLHFDPTNSEIHGAVARWYWDQEIHDWFGRHATRLEPLDVRWYVVADQDKRSGRDWQRLLLKAHAIDRASALVQDIEADPNYPARKDKEARFLALITGEKGASHASYHRIRTRLEQSGRLVVEPLPPMRLRRSRPPGRPSVAELDSLASEGPPQTEEPDGPADLPAHDAFARPIRGEGVAPAVPHRPVLDDTLPWERRPEDDGDE